MSALSIRPALYPAAHARPVEAVAEIVEPDSQRTSERVLRIRVEVAQPAVQAPVAAAENFEAPRRSLHAETWSELGFDGLPLAAASVDRGRAAAAYAAHASASTAPPPPTGVVIRCRA